MSKFLLNESTCIDELGDLTCFNNLDEIELYIEPIDVENFEYTVFNTEGEFFTINVGEKFGSYSFAKVKEDRELAWSLIEEHLKQIGIKNYATLSIEQKAELCGKIE